MKYADLLEECLSLVRSGENPERLIATHPEHADQLRLDLATARDARATVRDLPAPADARPQLRAELAARREMAARRRLLRLPRFLPAPALAGAAVAAVALIAALAVFTLPSNTAEASIEGVVVENDGATLTVQTEDGLQSIALAGSGTVSSESGARLALASLEPGQLLRARGNQGDAGKLIARRIELQAADELPPWCERFAASCAAVEKIIAQRIAECQRDAPACQGLRDRHELIRDGVSFLERLNRLRERCETGTIAACREAQQLCDSRRPICAQLREWLPTQAPAGR